MPTNEERREVARRLRETGEELGSGALLWYHIAKALGVRTATDGKTACGMLADLIDPDLSKSVPEFDSSAAESAVAAKGRTVDRDALLALADDMQWSVDHQDGIRSIMRDFKLGKLSEEKIVEMLVLGWEKDAKTIREAVDA